MEDNLLHADGSIQHHGEVPAKDEELTPTLENLIVLTWLRLIHPELLALVKHRYGTELRLKTLASLKPEISMALDSLLDEVHSLADAEVLRASFKNTHKKKTYQATARNVLLKAVFCVSRLADIISTILVLANTYLRKIGNT